MPPPRGWRGSWTTVSTDSVDTLRLHGDALAHRINTAPGPLFSVKDRYRNCLRMNCGIPWTAEIEAALQTLGDLAQKQL